MECNEQCQLLLQLIISLPKETEHHYLHLPLESLQIDLLCDQQNIIKVYCSYIYKTLLVNMIKQSYLILVLILVM